MKLVVPEEKGGCLMGLDGVCMLNRVIQPNQYNQMSFQYISKLEAYNASACRGTMTIR